MCACVCGGGEHRMRTKRRNVPSGDFLRVSQGWRTERVGRCGGNGKRRNREEETGARCQITLRVKSKVMGFTAIVRLQAGDYQGQVYVLCHR